MEYGGKRGCVTEMGPRFKPLEAPEARETTAPGGKQQQPSPVKLFTQLHVTSSRPEPLRAGREAQGQKADGRYDPFPDPLRPTPPEEWYCSEEPWNPQAHPPNPPQVGTLDRGCSCPTHCESRALSHNLLNVLA